MDGATGAILFLTLGGAVLALWQSGVFASPGQGAGVQSPDSMGYLFPIETAQADISAGGLLDGAGVTASTAPVDILSGLSDVEVMARTIYAEDRSGGTAGMSAVAAVIMNRVKSGRYPGKVKAVCLQNKQFSCWNNQNPNASTALAVQRGNAIFDRALSIAASAVTGLYDDPTGGATLYYSPRAMVPAYSLPSWDFSKLALTTVIDGQNFYREVA